MVVARQGCMYDVNRIKGDQLQLWMFEWGFNMTKGENEEVDMTSLYCV